MNWLDEDKRRAGRREAHEVFSTLAAYDGARAQLETLEEPARGKCLATLEAGHAAAMERVRRAVLEGDALFLRHLRRWAPEPTNRAKYALAYKIARAQRRHLTPPTIHEVSFFVAKMGIQVEDCDLRKELKSMGLPLSRLR